MIMIPSNIAYFVLGFITCLALIFLWAIHTIRKEETKRKELMESYMKMFAELDKTDKEE